MIPGDEHFGFDPNAFVQRLIDDTGISHVWKPVATKVGEGGRTFVLHGGLLGEEPERKAKRQARELVWIIWKRFAPSLDDVLSHSDKEQTSEVVATLFADFLMDNIDLVHQVESSLKSGKGGGEVDLLSEVERRAQGWGRQL
jgi:hypothetical protein